MEAEIPPGMYALEIAAQTKNLNLARAEARAAFVRSQLPVLGSRTRAGHCFAGLHSIATLGDSMIEHLRRVAHNCAVLQLKSSGP
jgi:hypothetical protein